VICRDGAEALWEDGANRTVTVRPPLPSQHGMRCMPCTCGRATTTTSSALVWVHSCPGYLWGWPLSCPGCRCVPCRDRQHQLQRVGGQRSGHAVMAQQPFSPYSPAPGGRHGWMATLAGRPVAEAATAQPAVGRAASRSDAGRTGVAICVVILHGAHFHSARTRDRHHSHHLPATSITGPLSAAVVGNGRMKGGQGGSHPHTSKDVTVPNLSSGC
jgi:hypothetical protein